MSALQDLTSLLEWVEAGLPEDPPSYPENVYCAAVGICGNTGLSELVHRAQGTWPEFSGDTEYPVPGGEFAYYDCTLSKWAGKYGEARIRLLKHCIKYARENQA